MKITHTMFDFHHGQSEERLQVIQDGKLVAYLDYSVYEDEPHIKMIESYVPRKGYARALVLELQRRFPNREIDWGMVTGDGAKLYRTLQFKEIVDPVIKTKTDLLARVKEKLADLSRKVNPENAASLGDVWNRLYDIEYRLEDELRNAKMSQRIIVG